MLGTVIVQSRNGETWELPMLPAPKALTGVAQRSSKIQLTTKNWEVRRLMLVAIVPIKRELINLDH